MAAGSRASGTSLACAKRPVIERTRSDSSTSEAPRRSRLVHSSRGRCSDEALTGVAVAPTARMPDSDTATVRSASTAAVGSIGMGLMRPPSTSTRPLMTAGVMTPGMAMEARMARSTGPCWNHTSRRALMSVATAVNGMGRLSIVAPPRISPTFWMMRSARMAPPGEVIDRSSRRHTSRWLRPRAHSVYSSSLPAAVTPPTSAPIDVPAIATISKPRSRSTSMAPMWA